MRTPGPAAARRLARIAVDAVGKAMQTGFPPLASLLILAAYTLVFGSLAIRSFKW
jgi:hypothetical protein